MARRDGFPFTCFPPYAIQCGWPTTGIRTFEAHAVRLTAAAAHGASQG